MQKVSKTHYQAAVNFSEKDGHAESSAAIKSKSLLAGKIARGIAIGVYCVAIVALVGGALLIFLS